MKESVKYLFSVAVLFMLLPFLMTVLLSGRSAVALSRNIDLEMLIPVQVYQEIPDRISWTKNFIGPPIVTFPGLV